ncbi:MAG: permease-like cell division protein FtsX [Salinivirgaceae bacterium]|nr:permease-like cell division protein FtsX [Salinivirgaceae bacterium]
MSKKESHITSRQLRSSYLTTIISISLVLFVIGLVGLLILNAHKISRHVKENICITVFLNNNLKDIEMKQYTDILKTKRFVRSTEFISKEQAAMELKDELGEDFVNFLGYNPLLPSIEVKLKAEYANTDSIAKIEKEIIEDNEKEKVKEKRPVKEVSYQKSLIEAVNQNIKKISIVLLIFCGLLFIISLSLINNTIRLSVYARRFLIKTMELVGATRAFVRAPFVIKSLWHSLISILIAFILLGGVIYMIDKHIPELSILYELDTIAILYACIMVIGFAIVWCSTTLAVNRYLRMKGNDLYA